MFSGQFRRRYGGIFFFSSRRRHTRCSRDWSSDVCSSDLTTHLSARERAAFREHLEQLSNSVTLARRAETYLRYYAGGFAAVVFVLGAFAVIAAVPVAGHLSRQLSPPIEIGRAHL